MLFWVTVFGLVRVVTLGVERVALNQLGRRGLGVFATMGVGFGGAAVFLWAMLAWEMHAIHLYWIPSALWTGALYALSFGFYTAALARGNVSEVSPWSNATVILLWCFHPIMNPWAIAGLGFFAAGAFLMTNHRFSWPIIWMILSDVGLAVARLIDVSHSGEDAILYSTSLFTVIALWMVLAVVVTGRARRMARLVKRTPGWSFVAASSNASAYLSLFLLLRWVHPAAVESISAIASALAAISSMMFFHETFSKQKITSSLLMAFGTILLLFGQAHTSGY